MYYPLPLTSRMQRVWNCRSLVVATVAAALLAGNGCVIVEKQSLVVELPAEEDSIEVVFVYEGISENPEYAEQAVDEIQRKLFHPWQAWLKLLAEKSQASGPKSYTEVDKYLHLLAKRTTLEETQYFLDKSRERQLCAYQRLTFVDRTMLVDELNTLLNNQMRDFFEQDLEQIQDDLKIALEAAKHGATESEKQQIALSGVQPAFELAQTFVQVFGRLDAGSLEKLKAAVEGNHRWIQCKAGTMEIVIPITAEAASKVADDAETKRLIGELKSFFPGVTLNASEAGLQLKFGKPGRPITIQYEVQWPVEVARGARLIQAAGNPKPLADFEKQKDKISLAEYLLGLEQGKTIVKTEIPTKKLERERP